MILYLDTETELIKNNQVPDLIVAQYAVDDAPVKLSKTNDLKQLRDLFLASDLVVGHNIFFDLAVLMKTGLLTEREITAKFAKKQVFDTYINQTLHLIASGALQFQKRGSLSLAGLAKTYCGINLDKSDTSVRTRFEEVAYLEVSQWPEEFIKYATEDVLATRAVHKFMTQRVQSPDFALQCFSAWVLYVSSHVRGIPVDTEHAHRLYEQCLAVQRDLQKQLIEGGLLKVDKKGKVTADQSALQKRVQQVCAELSIDLKKTASGRVATGKDVIADVGDHDPILRVLKQYKSEEKLISTYLTPLKNCGGRLFTSANALVATGRTSWRDPSLQVFPGKGGIRESFIPEPGHYLMSVDYDSLELRVLAQILLWVVGQSNLAKGYMDDPNFDPHSWLGSYLAKVPYKEFLANKNDPELAPFRQRAKAGNFGFAGGMGAEKFCIYAKQYGFDLKIEDAKKLKNMYLAAYPEMQAYFRWIGRVADTSGVLKQLPLGRVRGGITFCDGCNTLFQGGAADGAKLALCRIYTESLLSSSPLFGSSIVAFVHDEYVISSPKERAADSAKRVVNIMEKSMSDLFPDIPFRASPALMTRWIKSAKERFDANGKLIPYDLDSSH